jgi:hypothetical protein
VLEARLWQGRKRKVEEVHLWRERRSSRGELVQWDISDHNWLEGRGGERIYLIHMIDDATSELTARFVAPTPPRKTCGCLKTYLERHARPVAFYTDKASLFQTAPKVARDQKELVRDERQRLPPTQIGRALAELGIVWQAAHSPQAKGRVERSFQTAQDRLVKGLRVAGAVSLEQANAYLETEFLPCWNQHLKVTPKNSTDTHRPLTEKHDLDASLSIVETRQVTNDYTLRFDSNLYQIARAEIRTGLRGCNVRIESRLEGSLRVRFQQHYLSVSQCLVQPQANRVAIVAPHKSLAPRPAPLAVKQAHRDFLAASAMPLWKAAQIDRTRTTDTLEE